MQRSTAVTRGADPTGATPAASTNRSAPPRRKPWFVELYGTAVGKKYVMAVTGVIWMLFTTAHLIGLLKAFFGVEEVNSYGEWLRHLGEPALHFSWFLWGMRIVLIVALVLHVHAAYALTVMNHRARPLRYSSQRDYVAATFASRTMRWTGVIFLLFLLYHLMDFTWGNANPDFVRGDAYGNMVASFERIPVVIVYVIAHLALGLHLYHGAWSLFQSLGINNPRFNQWRWWFSVGYSVAITAGYLSLPAAVLLGVF